MYRDPLMPRYARILEADKSLSNQPFAVLDCFQKVPLAGQQTSVGLAGEMGRIE